MASNDKFKSRPDTPEGRRNAFLDHPNDHLIQKEKWSYSQKKEAVDLLIQIVFSSVENDAYHGFTKAEGW